MTESKAEVATRVSQEKKHRPKLTNESNQFEGVTIPIITHHHQL